jgi:hypothetical protein
VRKRTEFNLCGVHTQWYSTRGTRERIAAMFWAGGDQLPCGPQLCSVKPGSDLFAPHVTDGLAEEWVRTWPANSAQAAASPLPTGQCGAAQ